MSFKVIRSLFIKDVFKQSPETYVEMHCILLPAVNWAEITPVFAFLHSPKGENIILKKNNNSQMDKIYSWKYCSESSEAQFSLDKH